MQKCRSVSSGITRATSEERSRSPMLKFNAFKADSLKLPLPSQYPLKFPKRLMHKPTEMTMLNQTA